jgi:hypothetical protein
MAVHIPKWEYKAVLHVDDESLNKLGREGWELVCAGGSGGNYLYFKRPVEVAEVKSEKKSFKYEEFI